MRDFDRRLAYFADVAAIAYLVMNTERDSMRRYLFTLALTRDRLVGGRDPPLPLGFSWRTSVTLQISSRNLAYLSVHQFYVLTQNFGSLKRRFELYRFK